jgi:hypothetical protein
MSVAFYLISRMFCCTQNPHVDATLLLNSPATEIFRGVFVFIHQCHCEGDVFRPKQSPNYEEIASSLSLLAMTPSRKGARNLCKPKSEMSLSLSEYFLSARMDSASHIFIEQNL